MKSLLYKSRLAGRVWRRKGSRDARVNLFITSLKKERHT
jgi:hypothetical protein